MVATGVTAALVLYAFALWFGNLNQDEGWYLYAAQMVASGSLPYRDFFFTQGPVMPFVYGKLVGLWAGHGVLGGRVLTAILGLLSCVCVAGMAQRCVPGGHRRVAAITGFVLTGCNLYHVYFTTIPKTYALASLLLLGGFWILTACVPRPPVVRSFATSLWALPAGLLIAAATGVRLSLGVLLPVTTLGLLITFRRTGAAFFWFAVGALISLALIYAPFLLMTRDAFVFSHTFHTGRAGYDPMFMAGSLARIMRAYLPLFVTLTGIMLFGHAKKVDAATTPSHTVRYRGYIWPIIWLSGFMSVFILQLCTPHPYDDYQVPIMGLAAAAVAGWYATLFDKPGAQLRAGTLILLFSLAASFSSPLVQEWFMLRQDRFWVIMRSKPQLALLREVGAEIREIGNTSGEILTQDTYLAVETGLRVPRGLEMGPFSYFPDLPDSQAEQYHVMNRSRLFELVEKCSATVAAYSGYGFAIQSPIMDELPFAERQQLLTRLYHNYDTVLEVPDFGQNNTTLRLLVRRQP